MCSRPISPSVLLVNYKYPDYVHSFRHLIARMSLHHFDYWTIQFFTQLKVLSVNWTLQREEDNRYTFESIANIYLY